MIGTQLPFVDSTREKKVSPKPPLRWVGASAPRGGVDESRLSSEDAPDHMAMHVCQPALDAVVVKAEALVVEAQQV